jgi:hypothetical protein
MRIPLCRFIAMPIVKLVLKIDVLKWAISRGRKCFLVSPTNWYGEEIYVFFVEESWGPFWKKKNDKFEKFL